MAMTGTDLGGRCVPCSASLQTPKFVLQSPFHVEYLTAACSVTAWHAADVTVRNGNGRLLRTERACDTGRPWLVPGFCEKTRGRHGRGGQHRGCRGVRGESRRAGQRLAGPDYAAAAHSRGGAGLHPGAVAGDAGELLGPGAGGRARGAAPDAGPAEQEQVVVGGGPRAAAGPCAGGPARRPG